MKCLKLNNECMEHLPKVVFQHFYVVIVVDECTWLEIATPKLSLLSFVKVNVLIAGDGLLAYLSITHFGSRLIDHH